MEEKELQVVVKNGEQLCISRALTMIYGNQMVLQGGMVDQVNNESVWIKFKVFHPVSRQETDFSIEGVLDNLSINDGPATNNIHLLKPDRFVNFTAINDPSMDEIPTPWKVKKVYVRDSKTFNDTNDLRAYLKSFQFIDSSGCECRTLLSTLIKRMERVKFVEWAQFHKHTIIKEFDQLLDKQSNEEDKDEKRDLPVEETTVYFEQMADLVFERYNL